MDWDDLYMKYYDLVESGEIDLIKISIENWVENRVSELGDR